MVTLFVSDLQQVCMLEYALANAHIDFTVELDDGRYGLTTPYIKVHGVPLDEKRAYNWIKENRK